jgi:predicted lipoprotein with Yx(FWY)xxD motif
MRDLSRSVILCVLGCIAGAASALGASSAAPVPPAHAEMTDDGLILVTQGGMTLYTYGADDTTPGKSQCSDTPRPFFKDPTGGFGSFPLPKSASHKSCVQKWPPYLADASAAPSGDWSLISRAEGVRQWAFRGRPLYVSVKDHKPGDRNGAYSIGQVNQGGRGWRFALAPMNLPPGLKIVRREEGLVLATMNDRPVYTPLGHFQRACAGCAAVFEPIAAAAIAVVNGDWSVISAGDGRQQYAYKRRALYAAPADMTDSDILRAGAWEPVVVRKVPSAPIGIGKHFSLLGDVYTDKVGRTLYVFTCGTPAGDGVRCDDPGDAATYWVMLCGDGPDCAQRWQPYQAAKDAQPVGDWSVVDVAYPMFTDPKGFTYPPDAPRVRAWAYRGMPVYTYFEDKTAGDIWGNGIRLFSFSGFYAVPVPGRGLLE